MNDIDPIQLFSEWFDEELKLSKVYSPAAVCLSTVDVHNFPNARFVSFKELVDHSFIITGSLNSRKGIEIKNNNKVALTFWWTETERQVRIQGLATEISEQQAERYFNDRSSSSQAVSSVCKQGEEIENLEELEKKVLKKAAEQTKIQRPPDWSGFSIQPIRMEFMIFKKTRFHDRKLFEFEHNRWNLKQIQP